MAKRCLAPQLQLESQGHVLLHHALEDHRLAEVTALVSSLDWSGPGTRSLLVQPWCRDLSTEIRALPRVGDLIPSSYSAIQCTLFEKSAQNNWLVPIHQDLSVPVKRAVDAPGWGPWSQKEGTPFVQPPLSVLEALVAVRIHLDPCGADDGPLYVVPGTHRQGLVAPEVARALRQHEQVCLACPGDALVFRPLLLHRSSKGTGASGRRVLHLLYAPPLHGTAVEWQRAA